MTPAILKKIYEFEIAVSNCWHYEGKLECHEGMYSSGQVQKSKTLNKAVETAKTALIDEIVKEYL